MTTQEHAPNQMTIHYDEAKYDPDTCECTDHRIERIERDMTQIKDMVAKVVADVKPTLDELMNSSLIKMLGVKKKNG